MEVLTSGHQSAELLIKTKTWITAWIPHFDYTHPVVSQPLVHGTVPGYRPEQELNCHWQIVFILKNVLFLKEPDLLK